MVVSARPDPPGQHPTADGQPFGSTPARCARGHPALPGAAFCEVCGSPIPAPSAHNPTPSSPSHCPHGHPAPVGALYCPQCAAPIRTPSYGGPTRAGPPLGPFFRRPVVIVALVVAAVFAVCVAFVAFSDGDSSVIVNGGDPGDPFGSGSSDRALDDATVTECSNGHMEITIQNSGSETADYEVLGVWLQPGGGEQRASSTAYFDGLTPGQSAAENIYDPLSSVGDNTADCEIVDVTRTPR